MISIHLRLTFIIGFIFFGGLVEASRRFWRTRFLYWLFLGNILGKIFTDLLRCQLEVFRVVLLELLSNFIGESRIKIIVELILDLPFDFNEYLVGEEGDPAFAQLLHLLHLSNAIRLKEY